LPAVVVPLTGLFADAIHGSMLKTNRFLPTTKLTSTFLAAALAVLIVPACKKGGAPGTTAAASSGAPGAAAEDSPADEAEGAKLHAAIECLNRHSGAIFEMRDRYLQDVDPKTGAARRGKPVIMGMYGIDGCVRQVKEADAIKPPVPALDKASARYAAALEGVERAHEALDGYYKKDEQLDDKGKKALELHPKLMDAFKTFSAAHKDLSATVQTLNRRRRETKLAAREKAEGRKLAVIMDTMMLESETLVELATAEDVDLAKLDAQIAVTGKLIDEVDTYAGAHKDEVRQFGSMGNIKNYDKAFLAASKTVARKLRDKGKPTDDEYGNVSKQYNSLVTNYNNH
jgi:hypothetical protein